MKRFLISLTVMLASLPLLAQGWPANYGGVMLQGFYWDSYDDSRWVTLEKQASDLAASFSLIWIPQSANCGGQSMGYDDLYWFPGHYDSSFGNEQQLRSMIQTFKRAGLGTIADVVINHRKNVSSWVDFPAETYNGVTYELKSTDIVSDDDGGKCKAWATQNGHSLGNPEGTSEAYGGSCEGWDGMRDLDHSSQNVQKNVKAYLHMLLDDMGYAGVRYDMVKGYPAKYTGLYNSDAKPEFSVGEFWDGNATYCRRWIDATKVNGQVQSAAFDFPFRYTVRDAINNGGAYAWSKLGSTSIITSANYRQYAVTFVENHDTEYRSASAQQDPLRKDTLAANAWLLAMPGTPCVFLKHWQAYKQDIKAMIEARKLAGITNTSSYSVFKSSAQYYATTVDGKLLVAVGDEKQVAPAATQWTKVLSGYHYAYYLANTLETAWADKGSGDFGEAFNVTLTAVSANTAARLVYTLDGSTPTATNGTKVSSGATVRISGEGTVTLKVGLLIGSAVSGIITRTFNYKEEEKQQETVIPNFCKVGEGEMCAFFEAPADWTNTIYCWAWTDSPSDNFTYANKSWPGVACQLLGTASNGSKVWKWTWDGTKQKNSSATQPAKIIFNNNGQPQTGDMGFVNGGYYAYDSKTNGRLIGTVTTGIQSVRTTAPEVMLTPLRVCTADGRLLRLLPAGTTVESALDGLPHGLYVVNGKKYVR